MKKLLLLVALALSMYSHSQELQLHYDMGKSRNYFTGTFEIFKPDKIGNTFMFTDIDFNRPDGASLAYFEIARKFNIANKAIQGLNWHIEYNDGLLITKGNPVGIGIPIRRSVLTGFGAPVRLGGFVLHTSYLYKWIYGSNGLDGQFTMVWLKNFAKNKITFRGFLDFWTDPLGNGNKKHKYGVLLTEPQLLYNISPHFSIGSEIEISKNFIPSKEFSICPTIMGRWVW